MDKGYSQDAMNYVIFLKITTEQQKIKQVWKKNIEGFQFPLI